MLDRKHRESGSIPFPPLFVHFSVRAPAQEQESSDDEKASYYGGRRQGITSTKPVDNSNKENSEAGQH